MTQEELNVAVAEYTGEDLSTIESRGFGPADPIDPNFDPEPWDLQGPIDIQDRCLDWDAVEEQRYSRYGKPVLAV